MNNILHLLTIYSNDSPNPDLFYQFINQFKENKKIKIHVIEMASNINDFSLMIEEYHYKIICYNNEENNVIINNIIKTSNHLNNWKYLVYCDYHIEFQHLNWIDEVMEMFEKTNVDIVQLYSMSRHINKEKIPIKYEKGLIYSLMENQSIEGENIPLWACSKNGFYQLNHYFHLLIGNYPPIISNEIKKDSYDKIEEIQIKNFIQNTKHLKYSYITQLIIVNE